MHWNGVFRAALFGRWVAAGLPDPHPNVAGYRSLVAAHPCPPDIPATASGPLARELLDRVHGFGAAMGTVFADLLGVDPTRSADAVSWCGRFNLGISLVDYVCDESGRAHVLTGLPPFDGLGAITGPMAEDMGRGSRAAVATRPAPRATGQPRPEETVASDLAQGLLDELSRFSGRWPAWREVLSDMYRSELAATVQRVGPGADVDAARAALRSAAAGPFAVMAARVALAAPDVDVAAARRVGMAVGSVVWAVDDARDLWDDLARRVWNLYLLHLAGDAPSLLEAPASPFRDAAIARHLRACAVAEHESGAAVRELCAAMEASDAPPERRARGLGVVAAALALW